jgi:hypothetical protein
MNRDWLVREQTDDANDRRETFDRANRNSLKTRFPDNGLEGRGRPAQQ